MSTFHLYESGKKAENRIVITPFTRDGEHEKLLNIVEAGSWLEAKDSFGFELTATQKWLLDEQKRKAA